MDDIKIVAKKQKEQIVDELRQENDILKVKIKQLETVLYTSHSASSPEELICIEQISLIKRKSADRELSLDEVKRLDILIKNLRLIKDQSTETIDHKDYRNIKEAELVAIARKSQEDDQ